MLWGRWKNHRILAHIICLSNLCIFNIDILVAKWQLIFEFWNSILLESNLQFKINWATCCTLAEFFMSGVCFRTKLHLNSLITMIITVWSTLLIYVCKIIQVLTKSIAKNALFQVYSFRLRTDLSLTAIYMNFLIYCCKREVKHRIKDVLHSLLSITVNETDSPNKYLFLDW